MAGPWQGELSCAYITVDSEGLGRESQDPGAVGEIVTQILDPLPYCVEALQIELGFQTKGEGMFSK